MLITDDPTTSDDIVKMARVAELEVRARTMHGWIDSGDVNIILDDDPLNIRIQVGTEVFADPRDQFPTIATLARVQLALHAGLTSKDNGVGERWINTYGHDLRAQQAIFRGDRALPPGPYAWYDEAADFTATVTKAKKAKQKGLRP